jgi:hypothetical protein
MKRRLWLVALLTLGLAGLAMPAVGASAATQLPRAVAGSPTPHVSAHQYTVNVDRHGVTRVTVRGPAVVKVRGHAPLTIRGNRVVTVRERVMPATTNREQGMVAPLNYSCSVDYKAPEWADYRYVISSFASEICSGSGWAPHRVRVAVQWYLGLGLWSNRARDGSSFTYNSYTSWTTYYDCTGTGTHTYRTTADYYTDGGAVVVTYHSGSTTKTCAA